MQWKPHLQLRIIRRQWGSNLRILDQQEYAWPTELPGLLNEIEQFNLKTPGTC